MELVRIYTNIFSNQIHNKTNENTQSKTLLVQVWKPPMFISASEVLILLHTVFQRAQQSSRSTLGIQAQTDLGDLEARWHPEAPRRVITSRPSSRVIATSAMEAQPCLSTQKSLYHEPGGLRSITQPSTHTHTHYTSGGWGNWGGQEENQPTASCYFTLVGYFYFLTFKLCHVQV